MTFRTTVIIPAYNRERFIAKAIESVLAQTLQPEDIIVVDDGSTDRTAEIVRSYENSVKLIQIENNGSGPSRPRNIGIEAAKSKYITLLDSDDYFLPTLLERHEQIQTHYPDIGLVGQNFFRDRSGTDELEQNDPYIARNCQKQIASNKFYRIGSTEAYSALCQGNFLTSCTGATFLKSVWESVSGFDESLSTSNDYDFFFRVLRKNHLGFIDEPLFVYVAHNQNISAANVLSVFCPSHYINCIRLLSRELSANTSESCRKQLSTLTQKTWCEFAYSYRESGCYLNSLLTYAKGMSLRTNPVPVLKGMMKLPVHWVFRKYLNKR